MTYQNYIHDKQIILRQHKFDPSVLYSLIYAYSANIKTLYELSDYMQTEMPATLITKLDNALSLLIDKQIPLAYIIGYTWFLGYRFAVNKNVLCPRMETEYWTENLIHTLNDFAPLRILDMCCGSGVVGLSIKKQLPRMHVTLSDISHDAIKNTKINADELNLNVEIIQSDLFAQIPVSKYNVFICNPPYIDINLKKQLNELACEPAVALYAPNHGLLYYELICKQIKPYLQEKYILVFEIGADQSKAVKDIINEYLHVKADVLKDQNNLDRVVIINTFN